MMNTPLFNPETFNEEDWILLILYEAPDQKLNPGKIFEQMNLIPQKYPNARLYKSQKSYFTTFRRLIEKRWLESVKVDVANPKTKKSRKYPGYQLSSLGIKTLGTKIDSTNYSFHQKLNELAVRTFYSLNIKLKTYLNKMELEYIVREELFEEALIFLSLIDYSFFIDLYQKTISSREKREEHFFMVLIYLTIHLSDKIIWLITDNHPIPPCMNSTEELCEFLQVEHHVIAGLIAELTKKVGLFHYLGQVQSVKKDYTNAVEIINLTVYFRAFDPELEYIKALIQQKASKLFVHGSRRTRFLSLAEFIDEIYEDIIETSVIDPFFTGKNLHAKNYIFENMGATFPINLDHSDNQDRLEEENPVADSFKVFIQTLMKSILQKYPQTRKSTVLEIPTHIFYQLGIYPQLDAARLTDPYLEFMRAIDFRTKNNFKEAEPIFIKYWETVEEEWKIDILWYLVDCYRALDKYAAIPPIFERYFDDFYGVSNPNIDEFVPYLESLIDLEAYEKICEVSERYIWQRLPQTYYSKVQKHLQESGQNLLDLLTTENYWEKIDPKLWYLVDIFHYLGGIRQIVLEARYYQNKLEFRKKLHYSYSSQLNFLCNVKLNTQELDIDDLMNSIFFLTNEHFLANLLHYLTNHIDSSTVDSQFFELKKAINLLCKNLNLRSGMKTLSEFLEEIKVKIVENVSFAIVAIHLVKFYIATEQLRKARSILSRFLAKYTSYPLRRTIRVQLNALGETLRQE